MEVTDLEIFLKQPEHQQFLRVIPESYSEPTMATPTRVSVPIIHVE